MVIKDWIPKVVVLLTALSLVGNLPGQSAANYSLNWYAIDGGGGVSTGQVYSITGAIIQSQAPQMTGGVFTANGGSLGVLALVTPASVPTDPRIIVANLPPNAAIININARADGAGSYNIDQSLWYQPFDTGGKLLEYTVPAGSYHFRVISPTEAAQLFPALTPQQINQMYTAWTYSFSPYPTVNSPWLTDYLVFDSAAGTNSSLTQLFDGAFSRTTYATATDAYTAVVLGGSADQFRTAATGGRHSTNYITTYSFTSTTTLIFTVPDNILSDNAGGVSVLVSATSTVIPPPADPRVTVANLPTNTAIINIDARAAGAGNSNGDQSLWYQPFNTAGKLLEYTVPPGTYNFRIVNPTDAARLFPGLTSQQTNQIYTAWTYNSPWITDYLVFDSAAATNNSLPQLFTGAVSKTSFGNAADAYNAAVADGSAGLLRTAGNTNFVSSYTFTSPTTLIFAIPDGGLWDNAGGVSVLVSPNSAPPPGMRLQLAASAGSLTITWSNSTVTLQSAPAPAGPWLDVQNATSPFVVTPQGDRAFFRLRQP